MKARARVPDELAAGKGGAILLSGGWAVRQFVPFVLGCGSLKSLQSLSSVFFSRGLGHLPTLLRFGLLLLHMCEPVGGTGSVLQETLFVISVPRAV